MIVMVVEDETEKTWCWGRRMLQANEIPKLKLEGDDKCRKGKVRQVCGGGRKSRERGKSRRDELKQRRV